MDKNKEMETKKKEEQMTEKEASAIFCKAFYDETREIEARAKQVDLEVDEDRMEVMYQRMMAKMAADETAAETDIPDETAKKDSGKVVALSRKSPKHLLRWVAVLALVCAGVFGVSMQSQAGKDGLWSSIQRLIGVESRWEQKNNSEEREYTESEEFKTIKEIEDTLGVEIPKFFFWPGKISFVDGQVNSDNNSFILTYEEEEQRIYFEGEREERDTSAVKEWEGEGTTEYKKYEGTKYQIVTVKDEDTHETYYYVSWSIGNMQYLLSGISEKTELEKILKNIKN